MKREGKDSLPCMILGSSINPSSSKSINLLSSLISTETLGGALKCIFLFLSSGVLDSDFGSFLEFVDVGRVVVEEDDDADIDVEIVRPPLSGSADRFLPKRSKAYNGSYVGSKENRAIKVKQSAYIDMGRRIAREEGDSLPLHHVRKVC